MIRRVRTVAAAAVLAALASVVSACTSSSPTPGQASTVTAAPTNLADLKVYDILDTARQAMLDAGPYHVQGDMYMHTYAPVAATVVADGQPVLALTGVDRQLVVAAQGPPYPLH